MTALVKRGCSDENDYGTIGCLLGLLPIADFYYSKNTRQKIHMDYE